MKTTTRVVVIGGGVVGCSVLYHLTKLGWSDVVLLERSELTSGSTWHAAGGFHTLNGDTNMAALQGYTIRLYKELEEITGMSCGLHHVGGVTLADNQDRFDMLLAERAKHRFMGLETEIIGPDEISKIAPVTNIDGILGGLYDPLDGHLDPSGTTHAYAKAARMGGATIETHCMVRETNQRADNTWDVVTDKGTIHTEHVVNAGGLWAREVGAMAGLYFPLHPMEHQYIVTEAIAGMPANLPTLRDPDRLTYYKEEVGGLVMGGYESNPIPWAVDGVPKGFHYTLLDSNFDHFEQLMKQALGRVPALQTAGIKSLTNGPESFTPDGNFIIGEAPELANFYVGAGFNAFGIAAGGGAGMALAEWVANGEPPFDLWSADIRRFGRPHFDTDWVRTRTVEAYGKHYTMAWPHEENASGRPCRKSPLYGLLAEQGACFGEKLGWERPNWFADKALGETAQDVYGFGRQNWFDTVAREHKAAREAAVIFDQSSFAKFALKGPDAAVALNWIAANDVDKPIGSLIYTQMLNDRGGIECDLTVARIAEDEYYIVTGTGFATHDFDWISRNIPDGMNCQLFDVTSASAVLSLMGPKARDILQLVTGSDVSDVAFPFATTQTIGIAGCPVRALRITYVGELGWELHLPVEYATTVYTALMRAGARHGLINAGYRAIESCRLEKGYRAWGADIGADHTPLEAGLGWAVKLKSDIAFKGRESATAQKRDGVRKMLACFTVDDPDIVLLGRETIYRNGEHAGWLTSGGYGHTVGKSIGYGYVRNSDGLDRDYVASGEYELEVATRRIPCKVEMGPLYDPQMKRIKP